MLLNQKPLSKVDLENNVKKYEKDLPRLHDFLPDN